MRKEIEAIVYDYQLPAQHQKQLCNDLTALFESKLEEAVKNMEYVEMEAPETSEPPTFHGPAFGLSDHEKLRREHWSRVCSAYANHPDRYFLADKALEAFDNKFSE